MCIRDRATSMRSSMSIPGVFAPVDLDGMVLVDGGMVNNYPVDVAPVSYTHLDVYKRQVGKSACSLPK